MPEFHFDYPRATVEIEQESHDVRYDDCDFVKDSCTFTITES